MSTIFHLISCQKASFSQKQMESSIRELVWSPVKDSGRRIIAVLSGII